MTFAIKPVLAAVVIGGVPCTALASDGHHGPHIIELFLGATSAEHAGKDETVPSFGAQYRYAVNDIVSIGVLAEYSDSPLDHWVLGVPVVLNLGGGGWQLTLMPGTELHGGGEEFLFRTGIGYEFELQGGTTLKPEINLDFVDGETAVVAGVSIGWRF